MSGVKVKVEHHGVTYAGQIATIKSTMLGTEDHGLWTFYLNVQWPGGGVGVGGYCLDISQKDADGKFVDRVGTAYGLDVLMRVCETVGVDRWEQLPGQQVIVLFEGESYLGSQSLGIAGTTSGKVLILKEHAEAWKTSERAS